MQLQHKSDSILSHDASIFTRKKEAIKKHGQAVPEGHSLTARINCVRVRTHDAID